MTPSEHELRQLVLSIAERDDLAHDDVARHCCNLIKLNRQSITHAVHIEEQMKRDRYFGMKPDEK